jgi:hypothetical protein
MFELLRILLPTLACLFRKRHGMGSITRLSRP